MNPLLLALIEQAKKQGIDTSGWLSEDGNELCPEAMLSVTESLSCEQSEPAPFDSEAVMFEMDGEVAKAKSEIATKLAEKYTFNEQASRLNISTERHKSYEGIEKEGQSPLYTVFEMPSGYSRRLAEESINKPDKAPKKALRNRYWPSEVIHDFAEQIRARRPVGYMGHADMFTFGQLPENIPVQWETAIKATRKSDGVAVTLARGYVFDTAMNREYIKMGAIESASVFTVGSNELDTTDKGDKNNPVVHVKSSALISFDFVRKGTHGIPGTRMVANQSIKEEAAMTIAEIIAALETHKFNAEMLKKYFPEIAAEIAGSDMTADYAKLAGEFRESVKENVELTQHAANAESAAKTLNCEVSELPGKVSSLSEQVANVVKHQITAVCEVIKHAGLKKAVLSDLNREGITDAADVQPKFAEIMEKYRDLGLEIANENNLGSLEGEGMSDDDDMLSSEAQDMGELEE